MKRREFITLFGGAAAWPLAARAQQQAKLPTVGFTGTDASLWSSWMAVFAQRLRELGWIEGRTIAIEYRWNEGRPKRIAEIAAEFVRLKVDVIVTNAIAVPTLRQATEVIPIVFALGPDPVGGGLVASLTRPGGNVTGLSIQSTDTASKRLELLREVVPGLRRLAVMANVGFPQGVLEMGAQRTSGRTYVVGDALVNANRTRIMTFSLSARLPTTFNTRVFVQAGGLMSYGPSFSDQFRRTAELVDKILRGTKPGDIPVEQPTRFELVINLTTAKALGLTIPESFLLRADEVIE